MDVEYMWILWLGKNCRQFWLLFPLSVIGQFFYSVEEDEMGLRGDEGDGIFMPATSFNLSKYMIIWWAEFVKGYKPGKKKGSQYIQISYLTGDFDIPLSHARDFIILDPVFYLNFLRLYI